LVVLAFALPFSTDGMSFTAKLPPEFPRLFLLTLIGNMEAPTAAAAVDWPPGSLDIFVEQVGDAEERGSQISY
jgi:hypothetical protein